MRAFLIRLSWSATLLCCAAAVLAADASGDLSTKQALLQESPVALPGVGRVVLSFLVTIAIGIGLVYALRRWLPKLAGVQATAGDVRVISRASVHASLRVHLIEVAGRKVLVAEGKSGIAMTVMPENETKQNEVGTGPSQS